MRHLILAALIATSGCGHTASKLYLGGAVLVATVSIAAVSGPRYPGAEDEGGRDMVLGYGLGTAAVLGVAALVAHINGEREDRDAAAKARRAGL